MTVLYTSDEHGWVLPFDSEGQRRGGVAQLLAQLVETEHHCAGSLPAERVVPDPSATLALGREQDPSASRARPPSLEPPFQAAASDPCAAASTLLLSGGDNYAGPVISGYFRGATMAAAMARLGYAAAAFGNHEFDYGRGTFFSNRTRANMPYLAANMTATGQGQQNVTLPYVVVRRAGVSLGVIGLATKKTLATAMASRFVGLSFLDEETALQRTVPEVWAAGADAVILLAHECRDRMVPVLQRHPEWQLSFVGLGHCHRAELERVSGVPVAAPGWRLDHYVRAKLRVDPRAEGPRRAEVVAFDLVPVIAAVSAQRSSVDPAFDGRIAEWQRIVDSAFGEVIGHTVTGLERDSAALGQWLVRAWREQLGADVAVTTRGAIRQEIAPGPISLSTVYSVLPFDNTLVVSQVPGEALAGMLTRGRVIYAGVARQADGSFTLPSGKPLDPTTRYAVVTTDYLYLSGDRFPLRESDPAADWTGMDWRTPIIEWTRRLATSQQRPLEAVLVRQSQSR